MMKLRQVYLVLAAFGLVLPYAHFVPWVVDNGLDARLLLSDLFANGISGFFGTDVIISAIVLLVFVAAESSRLGMRRLWIPVLATLVVGVSCGLPLFLYMRETHLNAVTAST
jgi:hypothetical protein